MKAPWTPEQVENLNRYQQWGGFHGFTCGTKEKHAPGADELLIAHETGWACPSCDYTQDWAHAFMLSFTEETMREIDRTLMTAGLDRNAGPR
jgi:hypothetical protein